MAADIGLILAGLALLVGGAQALVRGASKLALVLGVSPLVVGLTIVAFGTSAPELAVSIQSCLADKTSIVLGNVIGSNIYNVLFILGISALITPLAVAPQLIRWDVPVMIGCSLALWLMSLDRTLGRIDGAILLATLAAYTLFVLRLSKKEKKEVTQEYAEEMKEAVKPDRRWWLHVLFIGGGLALLSVGSDLLVKGAVAIAQALQASEVIIGMTVVTLGTTAPELSACIVAAVKGERDIAVGNIVGSNIFNVLAVIGAGALVAPHGIEVGDSILGFGFPVMVVVCFSCLPVFFAGQAIRRWEGALFLLFFALYLTYLIMEELKDTRVLTLKNAMIWFVGPLAAVTVSVSVYRELRKGLPDSSRRRTGGQGGGPVRS